MKAYTYYNVESDEIIILLCDDDVELIIDDPVEIVLDDDDDVLTIDNAIAFDFNDDDDVTVDSSPLHSWNLKFQEENLKINVTIFC